MTHYRDLFLRIILLFGACGLSFNLSIAQNIIPNKALYLACKVDAVCVSNVVYEVWRREPGTNVWQQSASLSPVYSAMGFIINDRGRFILITAGHVAEHMTPSMYTIGSNPDGATICMTPARGAVCSDNASDLSVQLRWLFQSNADLAATFVKPTDDQATRILNEICMHREALVTNLIAPRPGVPLAIRGLAFSLPATADDGEFAPLDITCFAVGEIRTTKMGTGTMGKAFLITEPVHRGFSGTPVVCNEDGTFRCYGVAEGTLCDKEAVTAMGIVIPAAQVDELIKRLISEPE